jgi:hypothetical protein
MFYHFNGLYQERSSEMFLFFCITLTVFYYFNGLYQEPLSEMFLLFCITSTEFYYFNGLYQEPLYEMFLFFCITLTALIIATNVASPIVSLLISLLTYCTIEKLSFSHYIELLVFLIQVSDEITAHMKAFVSNEIATLYILVRV